MSTTSEELNKRAWMRRVLGVEVSAAMRADLGGGPGSSPAADWIEAQRAAAAFMRRNVLEHGSVPGWELLLKDPEFSAAVYAEDEQIRADVARDVSGRVFRDPGLIKHLLEERAAQEKRHPGSSG